MKQIKVFTGDNSSVLQDKVNKWIAENRKIIVNQILQSEAAGTSDGGESWAMTLTIVYDTDTPATTHS